MENIFHMNADVHFVVKNVIQNEDGIIVSVNVSMKKNIAFAKKTMPRILAYVLSSLKRIVTFVNTWKIAHAQSFVDDLVVTYDEIVKISEKTSINPNGKTNYWFIAVVLLAVTCQPLLMVIFVKCMKRVNFILIVTLWYRWVKQDKLISNILIQISSR